MIDAPLTETGGDGPSRRLLAVLGHELRNPLGAAMTGVELVDALCEPGDPRRPVLERVRDDMQRVADLLEALLNFGTGGILATNTFDLKKRLAAVTGRRGARVTLEASGSAPVSGVPSLLDRIAENLIDNALAAGAERVSVSLHTVEDTTAPTVQVLVRDNGPGIPADVRDRVFEPGVSGRGSTGLGLALAKEIAVRHGGDLDLLTAGACGGGTCFRITLPLAVDGAASPQAGVPAGAGIAVLP